MLQVIKRDGSIEAFGRAKFLDRVRKALFDPNIPEDRRSKNTLDLLFSQLEEFVEDIIKERKQVTASFLADNIENFLIKNGFVEEAKAYMSYRFNHHLLKKNRNSLVKAIEEKLFAKNVKNQNANSDEYSFGGRMAEVNRLILQQFALENCMPKWAAGAHKNNEIYIHDLDSYAAGLHNCISIPFDDLLKNGFTTRSVDIRPARSINTAFQLVAVIFQLQSLQQFGGCSATHLDWTMVPYVRLSFRKHYAKCLQKDKTEFPEDTSIANLDVYSDTPAWLHAFQDTQDELAQAVEGLYHNLNSLQSRSGNQLNWWLA